MQHHPERQEKSSYNTKESHGTTCTSTPTSIKTGKEGTTQGCGVQAWFTILELKDMECIDMNFYIKPGSSLEHMTCIGCNMPATTIHKKNIVLLFD